MVDIRDRTKKRKTGGHHYNALLFESRLRLRERFSFETCEIKSFFLHSWCPRETLQKWFGSCATQLSVPLKHSLWGCNYNDVNENVRHCDVGLATGGALNLVSLIDHTCLGNVCIFMHYKSHIFMEKKEWGDSIQRAQHLSFPSVQLICHEKCSWCFSKILVFFLQLSSHLLPLNKN